MYKRLSEIEKKNLRNRFENRQEYRVAYNVISTTSEHYDDLSPEEIWNEALLVIEELSNSTHREWKADKLFNQLKRKFSIIEDEHGECTHRTIKQQEISATLVLFDVICMLSLAKRLSPEEAESHPYYGYMVKIIQYFGQSILFHAMLAVLKHDEVAEEAATGQELQPVDYMDGIPEETTEKPSVDYNDANIRVGRLRKIYTVLQEKMGADFKGRSQWYYVYRLMAENRIYKEGSYTQFVSDIKGANVKDEHMPDTNTFSRKRKQMKSNLTYPNWQINHGGKQTVLEEGLKIAKIAFEILYK